MITEILLFPFFHLRKTITTLAFSPDGKYVVTGEVRFVLFLKFFATSKSIENKPL